MLYSIVRYSLKRITNMEFRLNASSGMVLGNYVRLGYDPT